MKKVHYEIKVGSAPAEVRNHAIISPTNHPTAVAYLKNAREHIIGVRKRNMDEETLQKNSHIIKNAHHQGGISIEGYYKDLTEHTYPFRFVSDPNEQSWFSEEWVQKRED